MQKQGLLKLFTGQGIPPKGKLRSLLARFNIEGPPLQSPIHLGASLGNALPCFHVKPPGFRSPDVDAQMQPARIQAFDIVLHLAFE